MEALVVHILNRLTPRLRRLSFRGTGVPAGMWTLGHAAVPASPASRGLIALSEADAARHLYILGASGSGKSRLLELLVRQHLQAGAGFAVIDPHGDLTRNLMAYLYQECHRKDPGRLDLERVYLIEPFRDDALPGFNALDPGGGSLHTHVGELVQICRRLWASSWGPRMEQCLRALLLTLASAGLTLAEGPAFLTDAAFRSGIVARLTDEALRAYWIGRYDPLTDAGRAAVAEPVLNKLGALLADPRLRCMLGQQESDIDFRRLMDDGAFLFLNCSKGQLRDAASLLGSLFVAKIQGAALGRADQPERERRPFTLFVDEFQNFRGDDFETIASEARKYGLRLVFAHQHLGQLDPSLQAAIFGNVGSHVFFAVAPQDAAVVARELAAGSPGIPALVHSPVGQALLHRRGHPAVTFRVLPVYTPPVGDKALEEFMAAVRRRHGRPRAEIEAEIHQRAATPSRPEKTRKTARRPKAAPEPTAESIAPPAAALLPEADDD